MHDTSKDFNTVLKAPDQPAEKVQETLVPYTDFDTYMRDSADTFVVPTKQPFVNAMGLLYCECKLAGETAELIVAVREGDSDEVRAEAGDVLWYISQIARLLSLSPILPVVEPKPDRISSLPELAGFVAENLGKLCRDYAPGTPKWALRMDCVALGLNGMLESLGYLLMGHGTGTAREEVLRAMTENRRKLLKRQIAGALHAHDR